jgi:tetratricopeptide (TPR) repeat protein
MRQKVAFFLLLLSVSAPLSIFAVDTVVGKIVSLAGKVAIDAFGRGSFIAAISGDILYASTVLKTEPGGNATVELPGGCFDIPSGATVKISDLLSSAAKKKDIGWLSALGNLLTSFSEALTGNKEELLLGSRSTKVDGTNEGGMDWAQEEISVEEAYARARAFIGEGRYDAALAALLSIGDVENPQLYFELHFWTGFCFFQAQDYADAIPNLSTAHGGLNSSLITASDPEIRSVVLFQLGASYYFLGRESDAVPVLEELFAEGTGNEYAQYGSVLLVRSLAARGDSVRARDVAEEAAARFRGTGIEQELILLMKGL